MDDLPHDSVLSNRLAVGLIYSARRYWPNRSLAATGMIADGI